MSTNVAELKESPAKRSRKTKRRAREKYRKGRNVTHFQKVMTKKNYFIYFKYPSLNYSFVLLLAEVAATVGRMTGRPGRQDTITQRAKTLGRLGKRLRKENKISTALRTTKPKKLCPFASQVKLYAKINLFSLYSPSLSFMVFCCFSGLYTSLAGKTKQTCTFKKKI